MTGPMALSAFSVESASAGRPTVPLEPTTVYVFEMRTGRVIDKVPYVGAPNWDSALNSQGGWSVNVALKGPAEGAGFDPATFESLTNPYRFGWAVTQGSNIWQAGPVVAEQWSGQSSASVSGGGFWKLLNDKRLLLNPARAVQGTVTGTDADTVFGPSGYVPVIGGTVPAGNLDLSLHTIAKRIVSLVEAAPGGDFPVIYPSDIAGSATREYPGYDLATVGQRLTDLTQVAGGPEIVFKPEFVDGTTKQSIQWRMQIGNSALGNLAYPHGWDAGRSLVAITQYSSDGTAAATRAFERGNGMNRDTPIGYANQAMNPLDNADVLLESVGNDHTSASIVSTLNGYAQNTVDYGKAITAQMTVRVRTAGDDGNGYQTRAPHQAEVNLGDNGTLEVRNHRRLPDGTYYVRIIGKSSTDSPHTTDMVCQLISRRLK
jgi:hypothetical protein